MTDVTPDFNPTSLPNVKARLIINTVRNETASTIQLPFETIEQAQEAQKQLYHATDAIAIIDHYAGRTIIFHLENITSLTLIDRLEEDRSRLIDVSYEKWLEEKTEEIQGKSNFGIGR